MPINALLNTTETTTDSTGLAGSVGSAIAQGFQTIASAITIPVIILLIGTIIYLIVMLSRRCLNLSKVEASDYKMEIKKICWYVAGLAVLFFALIFLITMQSTNWSIININSNSFKKS
ncbi:hypothetical protein KQ874_03010 [Mycoplasma sp. ES3157-GEN-MYC]|uniref:Uncharacterized protein n=1 Tax=Mycoplasma miroungigenitalium TaxID=754515 RepID=A0A6M4JGF7_9MOLU|nr:hypothetical protein [Mycoplasma miroungigenitalium]MBU4690647.1 hypothetical protein [Mycoplasma miroungigenitalium]MBU4691915.1 hypothetical protein [Mycoplasma miroungigenitalium]QJR43771.1 hypothetical protein HLA87_03215 [Mycoplasma miroungigenitalium]